MRLGLTVYIVTDNIMFWAQNIVTNNVKVTNVIETEDYTGIYSELIDFILQKDFQKITSNTISLVIFDREPTEDELSLLDGAPFEVMILTEES